MVVQERNPANPVQRRVISPVERKRVVKDFRALSEALWPADNLSPQAPVARRAVAEGPIQVTTPRLAAYLDRMRAQEDALDEGIEF